MPKIIVPGKRLTADVTHKIQPMITVKDTTGREWFRSEEHTSNSSHDRQSRMPSSA